jgi:integrase
VDQIEPHELLAVLKRPEAAGNLETAKRTRAFASRVFRYAVATARAKSDPASVLVGAVAAPRHKHFAAILDEARIGDLLRAIEAYSGQAVTLRRMGFAADEMTAHGFRAMASTVLNESGQWAPDAIERALAHGDTDQVRAAYHRGAHWTERVQMAQWWSDHLDKLRMSDTSKTD